jgi:peptidoglycan-associated lipoprotein
MKKPMKMIFKNLRFILLWTIAFGLYTANAQTRLEMADDAFQNTQYTVALEHYLKVMEKGKAKPDVLFNMAECYRYTCNLEKALEFYSRAIGAGYEQPNVIFLQGNILMQQGKYSEAEKKMNEFLEKQPNDKDAIRLLNSAKFAQKSQQEPTIYTVQNTTAINTQYNDYAAAYLKSKVVFTSSRVETGTNIYTYDGQGFSDLFETSYNLKDKSWSKPAKIAALSTLFNDGTFSYCEKTKTAYFEQCNGSNGKESFCTIMESVYDEANNTWGAPKAITTTLPAKTDIHHPAISADGMILYFVSKMDGGLGGSDIWSLTRSGAQWSNPTNLGININTEFDEMFPTLYKDSILYFTSEGHNGFGGLDIFSSLNQGGWQAASNMKAPFNSSADDFGIVFNADRSGGFFTSNRIGGAGGDDIYNFFVTPITLVVKGKVTDVDGNSPLKNALVVLSLEDGTTDSTRTNANGEYEFSLDKNKNYKINVSNPGYFGDSKKLSTQGEMFSKEFSKKTGHNYDFAIKRIPKEEVKIDDIFYDYNSYALREESKPNLDKLVKLLEDTPDAMIQINSHTDERGQAKYNMELSDNRAKSVVMYLIEKGIKPARLSSKGYGFSMPVVKGAKTEEEHQLNRRTAFKVINNN